MNVSVVIVGHVDHGKSTLIDRLLYDSEALAEDKLAEIQKLIEEYKKRFEFAYFLDSFEEELKEERTIDTTRVLFKGKNDYTIVDVPGHKEFIKNMLTGASHAQVAILVISAPDGIQEQTKRHAFLLHMLGIDNIIVAINKMDLVNYEERIFQEVKEETTRLLTTLDCKAATFLPVSAMEGDNIYQPSPRTEWYQGPTLIQILDKISLDAVSENPLRFIVQDTYHLNAEKLVVGRVESGILKKGNALVFQPSGVKGKVEKIRTFPGEIEEARDGDSVGIMISRDVSRGNVGGHLDVPPVSTETFLGEIVLLESTLKRGDELEMKCGTSKAKCLVKEIRQRINSETGEIMAKNADGIGENEAAIIAFKTEPLVMERFSEIPELGRFVLARLGKNIGAGIVLETHV